MNSKRDASALTPPTRLNYFKRACFYAFVSSGLLAVSSLASNEWISSKSYKEHITVVNNAGLPIDTRKWQEWYIANTHNEATSDWSDAAKILAWQDDQAELPHIGTTPGVEILAPDSEWNGIEIVQSFLEDTSPAREAILKASNHPTPVLHHSRLIGGTTDVDSFMTARSIGRYLTLDCEYAYYEQDTVRAIEDIQLFRAITTGYLNGDSMISWLVISGLRESRNGLVARTLRRCQWTDDQLTVLDKLLNEERPDHKRRSEMLAHEKAYMIRWLGKINQTGTYRIESTHWTYGLPSFKLHMTKQHEAISKLSASPLTDLSKYLENRFESSTTSKSTDFWNVNSSAENGWNRSLMVMIAGEIRIENCRKWVRTGIAIRRYKSQFGNWPDTLSDLEAVGFSHSESVRVQGDSFGYEVEDDTAYLWDADPSGNAAVELSRPTPASTNNLDWYGNVAHLLVLE